MLFSITVTALSSKVQNLCTCKKICAIEQCFLYLYCYRKITTIHHFLWRLSVCLSVIHTFSLQLHKIYVVVWSQYFSEYWQYGNALLKVGWFPNSNCNLQTYTTYHFFFNLVCVHSLHNFTYQIWRKFWRMVNRYGKIFIWQK